MAKLEIRKNWENQAQNKHDYAELIKLYNRLDKSQKIEFQQKLTSLLEKPIYMWIQKMKEETSIIIYSQKAN
ncbi:hypothetical protein [endosymbiont GvMRE of Glomus versiforme]|uniref:hypothetical protein n=1 Tax=endosymbiont GvMRE of Glomus versiforme TaxID=2039283 RepID=UPI000EDEA6C8|nr:hypothetical protein [endosymbiont GvMRE of Glomus versiforme]RHZ35769.1 hypothetical protein GvMRE_Ic5g40 [endosymbiont GvMRE of Glomus versiforme]